MPRGPIRPSSSTLAVLLASHLATCDQIEIGVALDVRDSEQRAFDLLSERFTSVQSRRPSPCQRLA